MGRYTLVDLSEIPEAGYCRLRIPCGSVSCCYQIWVPDLVLGTYVVSDHHYSSGGVMEASVVDGRHNVLSSAAAPHGHQSSPAQPLQQIDTHVVAQIEAEHDSMHSVTWDEQYWEGILETAWEVH